VLLDQALGAGGAVDALAEQVRVAVVAGVLLDHVDIDLAQVDVLIHKAAGVIQRAACALLAGAAGPHSLVSDGPAAGYPPGRECGALNVVNLGFHRARTW
jgi:hypothetical protein